jgi:hypothetical protein
MAECFNLLWPCECLSADAMFDIYGYPRFAFFIPGGPPFGGLHYGSQHRHPHGFARQPAVSNFDFQEIDPGTGFDLGGQVYNSKEVADNWFIPRGTPLVDEHKQYTLATAVGGYVQDQEHVWAIEKRDAFYAVLYNAVDRTEIVAVNLDDINDDDFGSTPDNDDDSEPNRETVRRMLTSVNQTEMLAFRIAEEPTFGVPASLYINSDGEALWPVTPPPSSNANIIDLMAERAYPRCCGQIIENQQTVGLFVGNAVIQRGFRDRIFSADIEPLSIDSNYNWVFFDASPDHWVGVVNRIVPGGRQWLALIDGQVVLDRFSTSTQTSFEQAIGGAAIMHPHVAHPHETEDGTYILIPTKEYATPPSPGNPGVLADPERPYTLVCYKDGEEIWRTPPRFRPVICKTSSDRWLYCTGWEGVDSDNGGLTSTPVTPMTGTLFDNDGSYSTGQPYWLIRHDGSQAAPCGRIESAGPLVIVPWHGTTTEISGPTTLTTVTYNFAPYDTSFATGGGGLPGGAHLVQDGEIVRGTHDVVKNSALVGGSLPADPAEWTIEV